MCMLLMLQPSISGTSMVAFTTLSEFPLRDNLYRHCLVSPYEGLAACPSDRSSLFDCFLVLCVFNHKWVTTGDWLRFNFHPITCRSVKWYWQSFFHSSRSSLSTCSSGATCPRLTRSLPSVSRCMMFNCKHNGRSVKVIPLKAGWKKSVRAQLWKAGNSKWE